LFHLFINSYNKNAEYSDFGDRKIKILQDKRNFASFLILFLVKDDPQKDKRVSEEELKIIQNGQLIRSYETVKGQKSVFSSFHYWLIVIAYTGTVLGVYGLY